MIVIYTQDKTIIRDNADLAKADLLSFYGNKLGTEAYNTINDAREGVSYRKNGGPLVRVVSREDAKTIKAKEIAIGMM